MSIKNDNFDQTDLVGERPDDFNQVEVRTVNGDTHRVEYVLRHPEKKMLIASRVTEVDDEDITTNSLTFNREHVVSIESGRSDPADIVDGLGDVDYFVHHSGTTTDAGPEERTRFTHVSPSEIYRYWNIDGDGRVRTEL